MEEDYKLKLEKDVSLAAYLLYAASIGFKKTRTIKSEELNFFIPEKWDYNQTI